MSQPLVLGVIFGKTFLIMRRDALRSITNENALR